MTTPLPMTTGRWIALAVGLPVVLAFIGWAGLTEVALAGQASYPVRLAVPVQGSTVSLTAGPADVRVTEAAGSELRLTGTARYSLIRSTVTWHRTPSGVTVSPQCHFVTGVCSFSLHAVLPAGKRAIISTGSGDTTLRGLSGAVSAGTGAGDIRAEDLPGSVTIETGSGDVTAAGLSGPHVTVSTGSGSIGIAGLAGARVSVSTGSGDIALTFTRVPVHVRVSASSGSVTLVLPPGPARYQVNATTDSGSRTVQVPQTSAPAHVITVTAGSGDISITN